MSRAGISRSDGHYELHLERWERELLRTLPGQLRELLGTDDPALERLFPPAFADDEARNADYARLTRGDLETTKLTALDTMEATIGSERLDADQMAAWLGALNDLRLVLGTRLGVTQDTYDEDVPVGDPRAPALALYGYLTMLQGDIIEALSSAR